LSTAVAYFSVKLGSIGLGIVAVGLGALGVTWFLQPIPLNEKFGYMRRNGIRLKSHVASLMILGWLLIISGGLMRWFYDL
jgi:hypothetical protein